MKYFVVDRNENERVYSGPHYSVKDAAWARDNLLRLMNVKQCQAVSLWIVCGELADTETK
jgi:hypothetical protein